MRPSTLPCRRPCVIAGLVALTVALATSGCTPAGESVADQTAQSFQTAVQRQDRAATCQLLSEETRSRLESVTGLSCAQALSRVPLPSGPVESVAVWGGNAQARLSAGVLFLAEFTSGWRVTAAGCTPRPPRPYDCRLES